MKRILLLIAMLGSTMTIMAQISGEIYYEEKVDLHRRMTGERAQFKDMVPQFMTNNMVLYFNEDESLYKKYPKNEEEVNEEEVDMSQRGGRMMRFRRMREKQEVYLSFEEYSRIETRSMFDKDFLIVDEPETFEWKLSGETMQVGDYIAHKATFQDSVMNVIAWFTPQIPIPSGPGRYGQLPGVILHVDVNEGERTITASEINLKVLDDGVLVRPSKGKKISQEEFDELMEERRKEFSSMRGGPGHMRRRP